MLRLESMHTKLGLASAHQHLGDSHLRVTHLERQ